MILLAAMLLAAQPAKLVIMGTPATVITYPSIQRCLAAKATLERQQAEKESADRARGVISFGPTVYCLPG